MRDSRKKVKRTLAKVTVMLVLGVLASLLHVQVQQPTDGAQAAMAGVDPGTAVAVGSGYTMVAAVKEDGRLYTRFWNGEFGWFNWELQGKADWVSVDITAGPHRTFTLIGVKEDGRLYTRLWVASDGGWQPWVLHGRSNWSTTTPPSISGSTVAVVLAAIKANGDLYVRATKVGSAGAEWDSWIKQGSGNWATADISYYRSHVVLAAIKTDGRLFTRYGSYSSHGPFSLRDWVQRGRSDWSTTIPPATAGYGMVAAVKQDGRLYTTQTGQHQNATPWVRHGRADWAAVDIGAVDSGNNNKVVLVATKTDGRLYYRSFRNSWTGWTKLGLGDWAPGAAPSVGINDNSAAFLLLLKQDGRLYARRFSSGDTPVFFDWERLGAPNWATG